MPWTQAWPSGSSFLGNRGGEAECPVHNQPREKRSLELWPPGLWTTLILLCPFLIQGPPSWYWCRTVQHPFSPLGVLIPSVFSACMAGAVPYMGPACDPGPKPVRMLFLCDVSCAVRVTLAPWSGTIRTKPGVFV